MAANFSTSNPTTDYVLRPRSLTRRLLHYSLHLPARTKSIILLVVIFLGSTLSAFDMVPDSAFSDRNNPVNIYLVKFSWGWTLLVLVPVTFFSASLYTGLKLTKILQHLSRLAISHVIWYLVTSLIVLLDSSVGTCQVSNIDYRHECLKQGHLWLGFDISGHVFLLTYCIYVITEECANIRLEVWYEYPETLSQENTVNEKLNEKLKETLLSIHKVISSIIESLELLCLALIVIWGVMVISTSLYFHTFIEKMLGYLCAVLSWYCTHHWLYGRSEFVPCKPNHGHFHPLRRL